MMNVKIKSTSIPFLNQDFLSLSRPVISQENTNNHLKRSFETGKKAPTRVICDQVWVTGRVTLRSIVEV
jgi:hypothetical protein